MGNNPKLTAYPEPPESGKERKSIIRLGKKITDRIDKKLFGKIVPTDPEYWGLDCFVTEPMAEVANKMKVRRPYRISELVKITGKSKEELELLLHEMGVAGIIEWNRENEDGEKQYVLPMFVPGSAEFAVMNKAQLDANPQLALFFERMSRLPLEKVTPMVPPGGAGIGMHVIPVEKAIQAQNESVSVERISHWLEKYEGKYAASGCSCRMANEKYDEGCADDWNDWCIGIGDMAEYLVETGKGRYITRQEVLEILEKGEKNGFVHQITNIDGEDKIFAICNCNVNVCYALRTSQLFNTPNMSASAYRAHIDKEKCVACGRCVEVCPAGAIRLGQKIRTKEGEVEYPKRPLPDDHRWGSDMWSENYRDDNRVNCFDTGTSPCKAACPAHISVQGYLKLAHEGKYAQALELIKRNNPFPAICGYVCNKRCEDACTRGTIDEPVAIDDVKMFIAQKDLDSETMFIPEKMVPSTDERYYSKYKVAIIGAGPAGLSCAYYLALKGYRPTVFEKRRKPGGMMTYGIPSFKLDKSVLEAEISIIECLGVDIITGVEIGKDKTISDLRKEGYQAFYLANGCSKGRGSGAPGEDCEGVMTALDVLGRSYENPGFSMSGKCVVIGGGNVAIDAARTAFRLGCASVDMFCLESRDRMPALPVEIEEAKEEGVSIACGWGVKEVLSEGGRLKAVVLKRCVSAFDAQGRFNPEYDDSDTKEVRCDSLILATGQQIDWRGMLDGEGVELIKGGCPKADPVTYQTSIPDIFAGGDVVTGPKFIIDAIAAGRKGAESIHRFVHGNCSLTIGRNLFEYIGLDTEIVAPDEYDKIGRQRSLRLSADRRSRAVRQMLLTEEQVLAETSRCLKCGASFVDQNKCIGCGLCTTRCGFDAIRLERDVPEASVMHKSEDKLKAILPYAVKRYFRIRKAEKARKRGVSPSA